ncbi:MAG: PAS domain S-box protein, partial [Acidobacteria bacterium]|nr:PAS domain S-box protein [Acidobacteriota bacterium]
MRSENGQNHSAIVNAAADAIICINSKQTIVLFNHAAEEMFECASSDAVGKPIGRFIPEGFSALLRKKVPSSGLAVLQAYRSNGQVFPAEVSISAVTVNRRKLFTVILRDISTRQREFEALRDSERRLRAIYDRVYEFIGLLRPDGTVVEGNQAALKFAGVSLEDVVDRPFWDTPWWQYDEESRNQLKAAIAEAAQGKFVRLEARHQSPAGDVITVDFSLSPVTDSTGRVVFLIPEGRDITDRKRAESIVRQQARLLELSYDAIFVRELHGQIRFWNRAAEDLYGWTKDEAIGQVSDELLKTRSSVPRSDIDQTLLREGYWTGELVQQTRDGRHIEVDCRLVLVREESGPPLVLETDRDITKRRQDEAARLK